MAAQKSRLGRGLGNLIASGVSSSQSKRNSSAKKAPSPAKRSKPVATKRPAKTARKVAVNSVKKKAPAAHRPAPAAKTKKTVPPPPPPPAAPAVEPGQSAVTRDAIPSGFAMLRIDSIDPNPYQPRRDMKPEMIDELVESIRSEGLLQPPVVRARPDGRYQLIAGERRWRACQKLGLKQIPVRLVEASDSSSAVISLIENLQRENLNPIDESLGYASLMRDFDLTQEAVAERVGKARASVANALRLLGLDREIQGYIAKGMLSIGHAKVILGLEDSSQRLILTRRIIESGLSVREAERQVKRMKASNSSDVHPRRPSNEREQTEIRDLEKQIASKLNARVQLKHTPKRGRIVIEYQGNDDLQRILERTGLA